MKYSDEFPKAEPPQKGREAWVLQREWIAEDWAELFEYIGKKEVAMKDSETIKKQAEAMEIDPFNFVYRLLELKDQECQILKERLADAEKSPTA